jgi:8-oxo-dGTP pyrophosphatase MutT (NUDIX family)
MEVVAATALLKGEGDGTCLLLTKRVVRDEWHVHGGKVNINEGETPMEAARRESEQEARVLTSGLWEVGNGVLDGRHVHLFASRRWVTVRGKQQGAPVVGEPEKARAHAWVPVKAMHSMNPALPSLVPMQKVLLKALGLTDASTHEKESAADAHAIYDARSLADGPQPDRDDEVGPDDSISVAMLRTPPRAPQSAEQSLATRWVMDPRGPYQVAEASPSGLLCMGLPCTKCGERFDRRELFGPVKGEECLLCALGYREG